jgi:hypothetical protein
MRIEPTSAGQSAPSDPPVARQYDSDEYRDGPRVVLGQGDHRRFYDEDRDGGGGAALVVLAVVFGVGLLLGLCL